MAGGQESALSVPVSELDRLAGGEPMLTIDRLHAGYGRMHVLHDFSLRVAEGRSICLVGPNGAGKSTVLNAIYGFARIFSGEIAVAGHDIGSLPASAKLKTARVAYLLQKDSVFPDMTVEENLLMGGYLLGRPAEAKQAAESVLERYPKLKARRRESARVLSGGERRLLEISRALIMDPELLLIDEPSIGLEPRAIEMIFETLRELRDARGKTLVLVEQNARKGLEFADIGYVLVAGRLVKAGEGKSLLADPDMGRLFLGGSAAARARRPRTPSARKASTPS
jgi:branched-chain amino acid transport system ATP-binding protein